MSVVIPVRNEVAFVGDLIRSVLAQDYPPDHVEVIVADGASTDGTRELLAALAAREPRLQVVDNPSRIAPAGLNAAVARSRGEVIVRIDGHARVASDFLRQNVALLRAHPEAWSVGGPICHSATTTFGHALAIAMSHPLGVGNALHRYPDYEGYVEGAQFPAFRRWVFDRIGYFDERLVRNQDDDFNYRIHRAGGTVYVSPRVRSSYFVRSNVRQLFKQYFQYGFWRIPFIAKHRRPTTWRQIAPTLFLVLCGTLALLGWWWHAPLLAAGLPAAYTATLVAAAAGSVRRAGLRAAALIPLAIMTMHTAYGLGLGYGLWARVFHVGAWDTQGQMTAISR